LFTFIYPAVHLLIHSFIHPPIQLLIYHPSIYLPTPAYSASHLLLSIHLNTTLILSARHCDVLSLCLQGTQSPGGKGLGIGTGLKGDCQVSMLKTTQLRGRCWKEYTHPYLRLGLQKTFSPESPGSVFQGSRTIQVSESHLCPCPCPSELEHCLCGADMEVCKLVETCKLMET
jgi:hypothetical protein